MSIEEKINDIKYQIETEKTAYEKRLRLLNEHLAAMEREQLREQVNKIQEKVEEAFHLLKGSTDKISSVEDEDKLVEFLEKHNIIYNLTVEPYVVVSSEELNDEDKNEICRLLSIPRDETEFRVDHFTN